MKEKSSYTIVYSAEALRDVKEATAWYNAQQNGLGKRFKEEIKSLIAAILQNPFLTSVKYETIRTVACKIFPYSIHYEVDEVESIIRIISIFHFSRKPRWLSDDDYTLTITVFSFLPTHLPTGVR